jgi:hypothetical protein
MKKFMLGLIAVCSMLLAFVLTPDLSGTGPQFDSQEVSFPVVTPPVTVPIVSHPVTFEDAIAPHRLSQAVQSDRKGVLAHACLGAGCHHQAVTMSQLETTHSMKATTAIEPRPRSGPIMGFAGTALNAKTPSTARHQSLM